MAGRADFHGRRRRGKERARFSPPPGAVGDTFGAVLALFVRGMCYQRPRRAE